LDTIGTLERLVGFYVQEHNARLPHSAFQGHTTEEMYFGTGQRVPGEREAARQAARRKHLETNRRMTCPPCERLTELPN
jgi:hypothetical protein